MKWISSLFQKRKSSQQIKVCWDFLGKILCEILFFTDEENYKLGKLDDHDPKVLLAIIREFVVPNYRYYNPENQEKIKNSLAYYLGSDSEKLKRVFPSFQIPLDEDIAKFFYSLVWRELYGTNPPEAINQEDYVEDCSAQYVNSLTQNNELYKKHNPNGKRPSLDNAIAEIGKMS